MDNKLLLPDLLEAIRRHEHELMEMEYESNTDKKAEIAVECAHEHQLITRAANSLEFLTAAVPVVYHNATGQTSIEALMEQKEALECLRCLSNNMDKEFVHSLYCENYPMTSTAADIGGRQEKAIEVQDKLDLLMDIPAFQVAYQSYQESAAPTIAELEQTLETTEALMAQYYITETDITNRTIQVVAEKYQSKELYVFEDKSTREEQEKAADNLVVVESNDGYVMATNASPELFKENPSLEREFSERVQNGNEIIHNEAPKETSIDFSKVGGNIKYEQYDDIGTVEKGQGVPTYEEKTEKAEQTERETSGNGKPQTTTTTTTRTSRTESYER